MPFTMTVKEYADRCDVSEARIGFLIRSGKLDGAWKLTSLGKKLIDPAIADELREYGKSLDKNQSSPGRPVKTSSDPDERRGPSMVESRAVREAYQARIAKLDYEERTGKLVNADDVRRKAFECARRVRDSILNIPDRIAAVLANETSEHKIHTLLMRELTQALEDLTHAGKT